MRTFEYLENLIEFCNFYGQLTVADFGCGAGYLTLPIAKRLSETSTIYAFDIQEPPLEALRKKAREKNLHLVQTIRADLEKLGGSKLKNESVDWVVAANILFQAPDKKTVIGEAYRILKNGGKILVVEWQTKPQALMGPRGEVRIAPDALKALIATAGLSVVEEFHLGDFHYGVIARK